MKRILSKNLVPYLNLILIVTLLGSLLPVQLAQATQGKMGQPLQPLANDVAATSAASIPAGQADASGLLFIENVGQYEAGARFMVRGAGGNLYLADDALWFTFFERLPTDPLARPDREGKPQDQTSQPRRGVNLKLSFPGANPQPRLEPFNRLATKVSYFIGSDPAKWRPDVPAWGGVRYVDLYPGVDLEITGQNGQLVQRLVVRQTPPVLAPRPGEGWGRGVRLRIEGADAVTTEGKTIRLATPAGDFTVPLLQAVGADRRPLNQPVSPPEIDGQEITAPFAPAIAASLSGDTARAALGLASPLPLNLVLPLEVGASDLIYGTFLGGDAEDQSNGIAVDGSGNAYVTGITYSSIFSTKSGPFIDTEFGGYNDAFVAKLSPNGNDGDDLIYWTYLGGSSNTFGEGSEQGTGIAVDGSGNAYVVGGTPSDDFPITSSHLDDSLGGIKDAFVTKLNTNGDALIYSTYLGGSNTDYGYGIALDGSGHAYVTGSTGSTDFSTEPTNSLDISLGGYGDAFVAKVNTTGDHLIYWTFLGGSNLEEGKSIAVDGNSNVYVNGLTKSSDFPTTPEAYDQTFNDPTGYSYGDAFVTKVNANGDALIYSAFLGGSREDYGNSIAADGNGNAYVTGLTSSFDFLVKPGSFDTDYGNGASDAFVTKVNTNGDALIYSAYLGGSGSDQGYGIAVDGSGNAHVTGQTQSSDFLTTPGAYDETFNDRSSYGDAFVTKVNANGDAPPIYSTFLGADGTEEGRGIIVDEGGNTYVTGWIASTYDKGDFPITPGAYQTENSFGDTDAFVTKLALGGSTPLTLDILDPQGNPVTELITNADGWPTPNPLTATVTLSCPAGGVSCGNDFHLMIDSNLHASSPDAARFYVYNRDLNSDEGVQVSCEESVAGPSSSSFSYTTYSDDCFDDPVFGTLTLAPGETKTMSWEIWIQPSKAANLEFSAFWGTSYPNVGYTANKTVEVPLAQIHPIVFLPGLGATLPPTFEQSRLYLSVAKPFDGYHHFFETLEKMGYENERTYFTFTYDWFRSVIEAANELKTRRLEPATALIIGQNGQEPVPWVNTTGGVKFDFVTHSTGGLIARAYIQKDTWNNDVRRVVMVAPPLMGLLKGYRAWEGLEPDLGGLDWAVKEIFVPVRAEAAGYVTRADSMMGPQFTVTPKDAYDFTHDPIHGNNILPGFLPVRLEGDPPSLQENDTQDEDLRPYPYDRQANPLLEPRTIVTGECSQFNNYTTFDTFEVCDPYGPYRRDHPDFETTYYELNTPEKMKLIDERIGLENLLIVYGNEVDTPYGFQVGPPSVTAPYWRNGERVEDIMNRGDGTVPEISARPEDIWVNQYENPILLDPPISRMEDIWLRSYGNPASPRPTFFSVEDMHASREIDPGNLGHVYLVAYTESQASITAALTNLKVPFIPVFGPTEANINRQLYELLISKVLLFTAFSPVELMFTDIQGRRLGYDPVTGTDLSEIPNSVYLRDPDTGHKSLLILSPEAGEGTLTLTAVDTGDYTLLGHFYDSGTVVKLFAATGTVVPGQLETVAVTVPATSSEVPSPPYVQAGPDLIAGKDQPVTFAGQFSDLNPTDTHEIGWNFGDGGKAVGTLTPSYTFANEGIFTVTLTVTDSYSFVVSDSLAVVVENAPATFQEANGQIVMEAEHFTENIDRSGWTWSSQATLGGHMGTEYMTALPDTDQLFTSTYTATSPELKYNINFNITGSYYVWVRGYAPNGAGDSIYLSLDDWPATTLTGFAPLSWSWANRNILNSPVALEITSPGLHTLRLWQREDGLRVDRILLTTDTGYNPTGDGPPESLLRQEQ